MSSPSIMKRVQIKYEQLFTKLYSRHSHAEMIEMLVRQHLDQPVEQPVFVEVGCGLTTLMLSELGWDTGAIVYSLDNNSAKLNELKEKAGLKLDNVTFYEGDSLPSLWKISEGHETIHFAFFDSAPSALHTFREFQVLEKCFRPGSVILIDNAALPDAKLLLSPCRKGKILVPYLLAHPNWKVEGHPKSGDSMVSAVYYKESQFAHPDFEDDPSGDPWQEDLSRL